MGQLKTEKIRVGHIPVTVVHPIEDTGNPVILYHGWSSQADFQYSKAAIFAVNGYTVYIPEAQSHGERGALDDYYKVEDYPIFWNTIFQNMEEFPLLADCIREDYDEKPFILGHSMGGMSGLGIGSIYGDRLKGIVSFNGSGDWLLTHLFIQARFGLYVPKDWDMYDEIEKKSPINHAEDMKNIPSFMTNGESDISIDPRAQAHFFSVMQQAGGKVTRITYPLLGHFVTTNMLDDAMKWMERVKEALINSQSQIS